METAHCIWEPTTNDLAGQVDDAQEADMTTNPKATKLETRVATKLATKLDNPTDEAVAVPWAVVWSVAICLIASVGLYGWSKARALSAEFQATREEIAFVENVDNDIGRIRSGAM